MIQETQSTELSKPLAKAAAMASRVGYVDIAKGIGITLVVMGHNDFALISPFAHKLIYSFHMPVFFFMTSAYRYLEDGRAQLYPIFEGKDSLLILRQIRDRSARERGRSKRTCTPSFLRSIARSRSICLRIIWQGRKLRSCNGGWRSVVLTNPKV